MKNIPYFLFALLIIGHSFSCTKENRQERDLEGNWTITEYSLLINKDSLGIPDFTYYLISDSSSMEMNFDRDNGFESLYTYYVGSTLGADSLVIDTTQGSFAAFINDIFVLTYQDSLSPAARALDLLPFPESLNTEFYEIISLNGKSFEMSGYLQKSGAIDEIILKGER